MDNRDNEFTAFLLWCAERLEKGESVEDIWLEWKREHQS